jgi:phosphatidylglycerophosphate synthase
MRRQVPNMLSWSRVLLSPVFLLLYSNKERTRFTLAVLALALALLTDHLDGPLARKLGVASRSGRLIDGLGDRALYIALILMFVSTNEIALSIAWFLIFREILMYINRLLDPDNWYPVSQYDQRLAQIHSAGIRLWLSSYVIADGSRIFLKQDFSSSLALKIIRITMLVVTLLIAYYAEFRSTAHRLRSHQRTFE